MAEPLVTSQLTYALQRAQAAVAVLKEDLLAAQSSDAYNLSHRFFSLEPLPTVGWGITSAFPGLCRDKEAGSVFHTTLYAAKPKHETWLGKFDLHRRQPEEWAPVGLPIASTLQVACPSRSKAVPLWLSPQAIQMAAALTKSRALCAVVRVEAINLPLDDVTRSFASREAMSDYGCRRLAVPSGLEQEPLPPSCLHINAPDLQSASSLASTLCNPRRNATGGKEVFPVSRDTSLVEHEVAGATSLNHDSAVANLVPRICRHAERSHYHARKVESGSRQRPRWLRIMGDSVTWNLVPLIRQAFPLFQANIAIAHEHRKTGPPRYVAWTNANKSVLITYEYYADDGQGPRARVAGPLATSTAPNLPETLLHLLVQAGAPMVYFSFGSHAPNVGGDATAEERFRSGIEVLLQHLPNESRILLALETARGLGVPSRFSPIGASCQGTNTRVRARGLAAARALNAACIRYPLRCGVVDLFSGSLPYIFNSTMFKRGDPVHPKHPHDWVKAPLATAFRELLF